MTAGIELPLNKVRLVRVRELQESALCFSYDKYGIHILVDRFQTDLKVILLNGDHAFHSYEIQNAHSWKGLAVIDYELVVDIHSALDTENEWPPLGALSLTSDGPQLRVATTNSYGISERSSLQLGVECAAASPGLKVSFTRWGFRIGEKDRPQHHWIEAKSDQIAS